MNQQYDGDRPLAWSIQDQARTLLQGGTLHVEWKEVSNSRTCVTVTESMPDTKIGNRTIMKLRDVTKNVKIQTMIGPSESYILKALAQPLSTHS